MLNQMMMCRISEQVSRQLSSPSLRNGGFEHRGPSSYKKVYGQFVSLNFIQMKLMALWKPTGRLDCVDLEKDFFLVHFSLKKDHDSMLRKGPWFLGEHFLSIRPWEPNFKAKMGNVSSIVVQIRLDGLPIENYEAQVLKEIGGAVGKVLRIDTHTASEARGCYARLCMQIDVDKPFITIVLIGKLEQLVLYEGIQKLCFRCSIVGHRRESHPLVIRGPKPLENEVPKSQLEQMSIPRDRHDPGPSVSLDSMIGDVQEGDYGCGWW